MIEKNDFLIEKNNESYYIFYKKNLQFKKVDQINFDKFELLLSNLEHMPESELKKTENYLNKIFISNKNKRFKSLLKTNKISKLEIILNNKCNLSCKYCYANGGSYNQEINAIDSKKIENLISKIIPKHFNDIGTVMFFGGEPLISFKTIVRIVDKFEYLYSSGLIRRIPQYTIVTNGTLITDEIARFFYEKDFGVTISIDGEENVHNILRPFKNGDASFDYVDKAIFLLKKYKVNIQLLEVTYTLLHRNKNISKDDLKFYLSNRYGDISIFISDCIGDSELSLADDLNLDENINYEKQSKLATLRNIINSNYDSNYCDAGRESFAISPSGKMIPCHFFMGHNEYIIGDLNKEIIFNKNYNNLLEYFNYLKDYHIKKCSNCWIKDICSECPASLLIYNKDNLLKQCNIRRKQKEHIIRDLIKKGEIY